MNTLTADIAVIGSGFGGCLTALILQRIGRSVVVLDQAAHPRFAIGESSTPSADMLLRDLSERYDLPQFRPLCRYGTWKKTHPHIACGCKRGFSYFRHEDGQPFVPDAMHRNELLVAASAADEVADTHWFRADVDAFFANEVRNAEIPLLERTSVTAIQPDTNGWRLSVNRDNAATTIRAEFVVDASGAGGVLPRHLGIRVSPDGMVTRSRAVFSHFRHVEPWTGQLASPDHHPFPCDAAALHHVFNDGWMWQLRFDNGITSAGLVFDESRRPFDEATSPEDEWAAQLQRLPSVADQFRHAETVDPPGRLLRTTRLQRMAERIAGPDWALLPHSAGFVDPLHSTGIAHTLCGVEKLTGIIERHWGRESLPDQLQRYANTVRDELALIDRLVATCYAGLSEFRLFVASCMPYFAAATTFEQRRNAMRGVRDEFPAAFLLANDPTFCTIVEDCRRRAIQAGVREPAITEFERFVKTAIAPYNTVGLCEPAVCNMYRYTAAEK